MRDFEYLELKADPPAERAAGTGVSGFAPPRRLYHAVGDKLAGLAGAGRGVHGYGAFGAVVGCTEREEATAIRERYSDLFFLIPGYGAQGGAADDAALLLRKGNGGVVNASRSILKAWTAASEAARGKNGGAAAAGPADRGGPGVNNSFAAEAARGAAIEMRDALRKAAV
jgi:orotidine-5'-phosphate decarboxylase